MWRNEEVLDFVERLRDINMTRQANDRIGFYGLDMYSMYRSANAVVDYLSTVDEEQAAGEWNVGQLVRERAGAEAAWLVGFTTCTGTVTAAYEWDGEAECRQVKVARQHSYEGLFHRTRLDRFYLPMQGEAARVLRGPLLERAIGVLYRADTEYESHYFMASIAAQFDAVFHLDETTAVEPLDTAAARLEIQPV
jgi:Erythromycin esterase homolog